MRLVWSRSISVSLPRVCCFFCERFGVLVCGVFIVKRANMEADVEQLVEIFKSKIKEAIDILPRIPAEKRSALWSFWQVVSPAVKSATGGRGQIIVETAEDARDRKFGKRRKQGSPAKKNQVPSLLSRTEENFSEANLTQDNAVSVVGCENTVKITSSTETIVANIAPSRMNAFVKITNEDKEAAEAIIGQTPANTNKRNAVVQIKENYKTATDSDTGSPSQASVEIVHIEHVSSSSASSCLSVPVVGSLNASVGQTPKRGRGRPRRAVPLLDDNVDVSDSSLMSSTVKTPAANLQADEGLKENDGLRNETNLKAPVKNKAIVTPSSDMASAFDQISTATLNGVRRSGRQAVPKKDDIYCYFDVKGSGLKSKDGDFENELEIDIQASIVSDVNAVEDGDSDEIALISDGERTNEEVDQRIGSGDSQTYPQTNAEILEPSAGKEVTEPAEEENDGETQKIETKIPDENAFKRTTTEPAQVKTTPRPPQIKTVPPKKRAKIQPTAHSISITNNESSPAAVNISALETNGKNSWNLKVPLTKSEEESLRKRTCTECKIVLLSQSSMGAHMRTHSGEKPFSCSICHKAFTTKANCERHQVSHEGIKPFGCGECESRFTEKKSLVVHMRTHTGERPYECPVCKQRFTQKGSLSSHMDRHLALKRHLCTWCGMKFRQSSNLYTHIMRHHHKTKSFKCGHCEKQFFTKSDLVRHERKHSGHRPFACDQCQQTFTRKQALKEHQNTHLGIKPYKCCACGMCFYDFASCHRHVNKHNKGNLTVAQARGNVSFNDRSDPEAFAKVEQPQPSQSSDTLQIAALNAAQGIVGLNAPQFPDAEAIASQPSISYAVTSNTSCAAAVGNVCDTVGEITANAVSEITPNAVDISLAEGAFTPVTSDAGIPSTVSGNVIVTIDGGREIHLQVPEKISTEDLVAHVQNLLREQNMDLTGSQDFAIDDPSAVANSNIEPEVDNSVQTGSSVFQLISNGATTTTTLLSNGASCATRAMPESSLSDSATSSFMGNMFVTDGNVMVPERNMLASDGNIFVPEGSLLQLAEVGDFQGSLLQVSEGGEYQVTLMDQDQNVTMVMEEGNLTPDTLESLPQDE